MTKFIMTKRKLYLSEILKRDNVKYGSNNLILSPTGSGKTYHMRNDLKELFPGKRLMLVSTESLKDKLGELEETYTTQDIIKKKFGITDEDIYIMTYAEFGYKVLWNNEFIEDFSVILCDEIHSLFEYYSYKEAANLAAAIKVLFNVHEDKTIFYYTATTTKLDNFVNKENKDLYKHVNIIDYYNDPDIVRYVNYIELEITHIDEAEDIILSFGDLRAADKKGFIFNERISSMDNIKRLLSRQGLRPIEIWSMNNEDYPMTDEQIYVRNYLLENERIPEGYDFIIFNGAMREGWDLKDERVVIGIMNTLDETNREQARGRFRGDLPILVTRVSGDNQPIDLRIMKKEKALGVIERILGKYIDTKDKDKIAEELNIRRREDGRLVKWKKISEVLEKNGYKIENEQKTIDGKRKRVSIVTKIEQEVKPSTASRASKFMAKLGQTKFAEVNKTFLSNYINKNDKIAYKHIRDNYEMYIGIGKWNERKFADITYLLARDNKLFSRKNYSAYGITYNGINEIEILTERAKYEEAAKGKLKQAQEARDRELLNYIAQNGGK